MVTAVFLQRHGLMLKEQFPPDHGAIILEFLAYLHGSIARALQNGDVETVNRLREDLNYFCQNFPEIWFSQWSERVVDNAGSGFYRGLGKLLCPLVRLFKENPVAGLENHDLI